MISVGKTDKGEASLRERVFSLLQGSSQSLSTISLAILTNSSSADILDVLTSLRLQGRISKVGEASVAFWKPSDSPTHEQLKFCRKRKRLPGSWGRTEEVKE